MYNSPALTSGKKPFYEHLYAQVVFAVICGVLLGHFFPEAGASLKPLGDGFIKLIKMMIAPIIFCTVVGGIAQVRDMGKVGRVGLKAFIYFEAVSSLSLVIGLVIVNIVQPGSGINADPSQIDPAAVAAYTSGAKGLTATDFILHTIPDTIVGALSSGEILQVLLVAVLFGVALAKIGEMGRPVLDLIERASKIFFEIIRIIMYVAPIGAFGAMAFTVGQYGLGSLISLGKLMACVYATCLLFVIVVLGTIAKAAGFSIFKFLRYIKEEILIVLGTSSSEAALPRMIAKMENIGCDRSVVGLVIPTGYSFNLDGTSIYLTMAAIFVAQATNAHLTLGHQIGILGILLLTSKGAAGVTGSGFITLAATLSTVGSIPVAGLALLIGIDRFMSEARAITNLIGNGVATMVVAKWEGAFDPIRARDVLNGDVIADPDQPVFEDIE